MSPGSRNSEAHPLRIDWLPAGDDVRLGLTDIVVGHGWRRGARAWWERDAEVDLRRLAHNCDARVLVCVVDADEAERLTVGGVREVAQAAGVELHRLTTGQGGVPRDATAAAELADHIAETLKAGRAVVVHATELGRAETFAAVVLCRLGIGAHAALQRVQGVRGRQPAQPTQLAFVAALAPGSAASGRTAAGVPTPITVYYHRNCPDGATAAWIAQQACEGDGHPVQLVPLQPGELQGLPMAVGARVYMLDVCVPAPDLEALHAVAADILVLDHHKTSAGLAEGRPWVRIESGSCGAMMAWCHFHGDAPPPRIVRYVEDMDLWQNALPHTSEVQRLLRSMIRPEQVAAMAEALEQDFNGVVERGRTAMTHDRATLGRYLQDATAARFGDVPVHAVCIKAHHAGLGSDIGNAMAEKFGGIAVVWRCDGQGYRYSLRSVPNEGPDVTIVAQRFGGGGHTHAAGCMTPKQMLRFVDG